MPARRAIATIVAAIVLAVCGSAKAHAFAGYRETTLPNGLRVVLIEHHANPMIASSVIVGAGVVHETGGRSGSSHLLEHLLFNGTTTRTQKQLYDEVDRYGAYNNATTREDHTLFSLLIQKEFVEKGLEVQADMLFRSTIPAENFEKEKGIVLEEMARDASDPAYIAMQAFRDFAWKGTALAAPVLGTRESIEATERDAVMAYYRKRYRPESMVLVVMGDFESEAMLSTIKRVFSTGERVTAPRPAAEARAAWPVSPKENLRTMPLDAARHYVHAGFPLGLPGHAPLVSAVEFLLEAAGSGDDAPLQRALTAGPDAPAVSAGLGLTRRTGPWSTIEFNATVAKGKPPSAVLEVLAAGLSALGPGSAARARVDMVRARLRASEILGADQIHYYAMTHADGLLDAPRGWLDNSARRFDGVTDADLDAAAKLIAEGLRKARVLIAGPGLTETESAWTPAAPAVKPPVSRSRAETTLSSGARLWAQRNDDSQVFAMHLALRPRALAEPAGKEGIASFLHRLLGRGTAFADAAALAARLDRLGASLKTDDDPRVPFDDYYTTPEFSFLRLELPADGWREGIALVGEILRYPRLLPDEVEGVRSEMLDLQAKREASSRNRAVDAAEALLAPGHPLGKPVLGTPASLASITLDDLRAFHRAYVSGRRLVATVVGPVDAEQVIDALTASFGDLPPGPEISPAPAVPVTVDAGEHRALAPKDQATIAMGYVFDAPEVDRPALAVAGAMLSDALAFDLRETKGLAYSIGASIAPWGGRMRLLVTMGTRKENLDVAIKGLKDGITGFAPADDAAVKRAAAAMRGRMLMRRLTRLNQAYFAGMAIIEGREPGSDVQKWDAMLALDAAKVAAAAKRHIDASRLLVTVE